MGENNGLSKLLREISREAKSHSFEPSWYYNREDDSIECFWEETPLLCKKN